MTADESRRIVALSAAEVLNEIASEVEILGATLCVDAQVINAHMDSLQKIDFIAQRLRGLGELLTAECPIIGAQSLHLETLRTRFQHVVERGKKPRADQQPAYRNQSKPLDEGVILEGERKDPICRT